MLDVHKYVVLDENVKLKPRKINTLVLVVFIFAILIGFIVATNQQTRPNFDMTQTQNKIYNK